jgi:hypothetical protein
MAATARDIRPISSPTLSPRSILRLNALAAVTGGSLMLLFAGPLARALGLGNRGLLAVAGLILIGVGSDELMFAVGRGLRRLHLRLFAITDVALVGGAAAFLAWGPEGLTLFERALVAIVAVPLAWFAIAEFRAARELR